VGGFAAHGFSLPPNRNLDALRGEVREKGSDSREWAVCFEMLYGRFSRPDMSKLALLTGAPAKTGLK
jgi:hypothetical protein